MKGNFRMNQEILKDANILSEIIESTRTALAKIKTGEGSINVYKDNKFDDGRYKLCISEYNDGSGWNCDMSRYKGNAELYNIIVETLERQLKEFEEEFTNL